MAPSTFHVTRARLHRANRSAGRWVRWVPALLALGLAVGMSGCEDPRRPKPGGGDGPGTLVVSETWMNSNQGAAARERVSSLQRAITELREETGTGWVGRQDDVTGYLAELSGGSRLGGVTELMDAYGAALFGVDSLALRVDDLDTTTVPGIVTTRTTQVLRGVPVLDGTLLFTGRTGDAGSEDDRVAGATGRVFAGLTVGTEPTLGRAQAARAAEQASGGSAEGRPELVVVPTGTGILTWEVTVVSDEPVGSELEIRAGDYYIDAHTGEVVHVRPLSSEVAPPTPMASKANKLGRQLRDPDPNTVEVTGADSLGNRLTGQGLRVPSGVELTDSTTQSWDQTTRRGGISTYDADAVNSDSDLPGALIVSPGTEIADPEAMAAHVYGKVVMDYYAGLGRNSWDGDGGSLISSVNYGPADFCNAFFSAGLDPPQMVYGDPCVRQGQAQSVSLVEPDVVAHEITHGVTATTAGLLYTGQSGALNEGFSDYFGNVIGDRIHGKDSAALGEDLCQGVPTDTSMCYTNPDGSKSMRYMLNGNDFDDYLRVLDPGERLKALGLAKQDHGGVHLNSAIWNNALWTIRSRLAQIDDAPGLESPLAQGFDRAVFAALTTRLTSSAGFIDARSAVEQSVIDLGLDAVVLRVAREVFDANKICPGCPIIDKLAGAAVSANPQTQLHPTVSGDLVAWLDLSGRYEFSGYPATSNVDGSAPTLGSSSDILEVGFAGESLMTISARGVISRIDPSGQVATVASVNPNSTLVRGFVGSDAGAAWVLSRDQVTFADPAGQLTTTTVPGLRDEELMSVGTGGGYVAVGTTAGQVFGWQPGSSPTPLGRVGGAVATLAAYDGNVLAIGCTQEIPGKSVPDCAAKLFTADGRTFAVSDNPTVLGAAMSAEYAVWPEGIGPVTGGVVGDKQLAWQDTDLRLLSLRTGKMYDVLPGEGQQGFPALSGRRLVWQDAVFGGDDIFTGVLPEGL